MVRVEVPMSAPDVSMLEVEAVNRVLASPILSIGPFLTEFESRFAGQLGTSYATGVSSGTAGLHLTMIAAGVDESDLVITTPWSFVASANCILYERGIPIFVDVDPQTGNIDPLRVSAALEAFSKGGPEAREWLPRAVRDRWPAHQAFQCRAVLPVHVFGQPVEMDPILSAARKFDVFVVEDACEAVGSRYLGRPAGSLGDASVFAFYPNKQITTGEGGMIVTDREDWDGLFRSLRNQGRDQFDAWLNHSRLGYNYRLDEMSAALGSVQISRIDELLAKREQVANWYSERLADIEHVEPPFIAATTTTMSWFVYVVRIQPPAGRNAVMSYLEEVGIPTRPYFSPIHLQPFYRQRFGFQPGDYPITEQLGRVSLALPFSGGMTESQVDYVTTHLRKAIAATELAKAG